MDPVKPRARNPRRETLDLLREVQRLLRPLVATWSQDQRNHAEHRPLREDEKRENSMEAWARTAQYADLIARKADRLRVFAEARATELYEARRQE